MVSIKTAEEIKIMSQGGKILAKILKNIAKSAKPGASTFELNQLAGEEIEKYKAKPAFKNYRGYPFILCTSVNEEVVHGFPLAKKILKSGDIVGLDLGIEYKGYFTDMAITCPVGKISPLAKKLIKITKKSLFLGLKQIKSGNYIGDISYAIQKFVEKNSFSVVRDLAGHGVGKNLHEDPLIPNFGQPKTGLRLEEGMTLAIEPMVNTSGHQVETLDDEWTVVTSDKSLSAHFEHTVVVTKKGYKILTK